MLRSHSPLVFTRIYNLNDKLPEDVLLAIFDAYRCDMKLKPRYENKWNSRDGWFKLAHVCRYWRRIVLFSPSCLHIHLLFTQCKSSKDSESVLRCLPRLPILLHFIDTPYQPRIPDKDNLFFATIEDRSRVRGITNIRLLETLSQPFPELQSLDIGNYYKTDICLNLTASFISGSALSLRRLSLQGNRSYALSPLLSLATGLVELTLILNVDLGGRLPEASVFPNLQRMSCLRYLKLMAVCGHLTVPIISAPLPTSAQAGDIISLLKLTDFIFTGPCSIFHMLVVRLAPPSLQHLDARVCCWFPRYSSIPPLPKFICETESQFIAVRLALLPLQLEFSVETSKYDHARSFRILFPRPIDAVVLLEKIGDRLSGPSSTVEEVVIEWHVDWSTEEGHRIQWQGFFNHLQRVKMVQLPFEEVLNFAHSFQKGGHLTLLPALKQIKVHMIDRNRKDKFKFSCHALKPFIARLLVLRAFKPLFAARKQVGHPIALSWV